MAFADQASPADVAAALAIDQEARKRALALLPHAAATVT